METNADDLGEVERLQKATKREAGRMPWWNGFVMAVGVVVFIALQRFVNGNNAASLAISAAWVAFVAAWVFVGHRGNRARRRA